MLPFSVSVQLKGGLERLGAVLLEVRHQRMADLLQPLLLPLADLIYRRSGEEEGNREWVGESLVAGWAGWDCRFRIEVVG